MIWQGSGLLVPAPPRTLARPLSVVVVVVVIEGGHTYCHAQYAICIVQYSHAQHSRTPP